MTISVFQAMAMFIRAIWSLFNSWYFPGTNLTPAGIGFLALFVLCIIRFSKQLLFVNPSAKSGEKNDQ